MNRHTRVGRNGLSALLVLTAVAIGAVGYCGSAVAADRMVLMEEFTATW